MPKDLIILKNQVKNWHMTFKKIIKIKLGYQINCVHIWQSNILKLLRDATSLLQFSQFQVNISVLTTGMEGDQIASSDKVHYEILNHGQFLFVKRHTSTL